MPPQNLHGDSFDFERVNVQICSDVAEASRTQVSNYDPKIHNMSTVMDESILEDELVDDEGRYTLNSDEVDTQYEEMMMRRSQVNSNMKSVHINRPSCTEDDLRQSIGFFGANNLKNAEPESLD